MISRGLTAGSFGIFEVEGGDQGFVVCGDGLVVFFEALDIGRDRVSGHALGFRERSAVSHASWQHRYDRGEAPLWFGPEHDIEMTACLFHLRLILAKEVEAVNHSAIRM